MRFLLVGLILFANISFAKDERIKIFGEANTADGKTTSATFNFIQPEEPVVIVLPQEDKNPVSKNPDSPAPVMKQNLHEVNQWSEQDPKPFSISPQKEKNEIENTLYEGGDRIYDVQSFPIEDIKTITEPNIDPTISTYPEY